MFRVENQLTVDKRYMYKNLSATDSNETTNTFYINYVILKKVRPIGLNTSTWREYSFLSDFVIK